MINERVGVSLFLRFQRRWIMLLTCKWELLVFKYLSLHLSFFFFFLSACFALMNIHRSTSSENVRSKWPRGSKTRRESLSHVLNLLKPSKTSPRVPSSDLFSLWFPAARSRNTAYPAPFVTLFFCLFLLLPLHSNTHSFRSFLAWAADSTGNWGFCLDAWNYVVIKIVPLILRPDLTSGDKKRFVPSCPVMILHSDWKISICESWEKQ